MADGTNPKSARLTRLKAILANQKRDDDGNLDRKWAAVEAEIASLEGPEGKAKAAREPAY
jgi:hypothetical protein